MERRGFFAAFFGSLVALVTGGRVKAARLSRVQRMARDINRAVPPRLYADRFGRKQVRDLIREIDEAVVERGK